MLEIEGAIVTIDAIDAQKTIAARIIGKKGDYLLALNSPLTKSGPSDSLTKQ